MAWKTNLAFRYEQAIVKYNEMELGMAATSTKLVKSKQTNNSRLCNGLLSRLTPEWRNSRVAEVLDRMIMSNPKATTTPDSNLRLEVTGFGSSELA